MNYDQHGVIAVIPARRGSKRLPGKNLMRVGGRSLLERAIESGLRAETVDRVIVSTDDPAVRDACKGLDVVVLGRSEFLSTDTACTVDVVRDVFRKLGIPGVVILLQPTSPFREACDIDEAVRLLQRHPDTPSVATAYALGHPVEWSFEVTDGEMTPTFGWDKFGRRSQDLPGRYVLNGSVYAARGDHVAAENSSLGGREFLTCHRCAALILTRRTIFFWQRRLRALERAAQQGRVSVDVGDASVLSGEVARGGPDQRCAVILEACFGERFRSRLVIR